MKKSGLYIIIFFVLPLVSNAQWQQVTADFDTCAVNCIFPQGDQLFLGTSCNGIFYSTDAAATWAVKNNGISNLNIKSITSEPSGFLYAGSKSLNIFTSADTGNNWTVHNMNGTGTGISSVVTVGSYVLAGQVNDGVFKSVDHGDNWVEVALCCASVLSMCVDEEGYAYAGTNPGRVYRSNGTFVTWDEKINGFPAYPVRALLAFDSMVWAATSGGGIAMSTDKGEQWATLNNGLSDLNVLALAVSGTKLFAGTDGGGVFMSVDLGQHWMQVNQGLTALNILALSIDTTSLYAGTQNNGLWKRPLSEMSGIDHKENALHMKLYPQPASDYLVIERSQTKTATLEIFSSDGRNSISTELKDQKSIVDISRLSRGLYFVRLMSDGEVCSQPLVID